MMNVANCPRCGKLYTKNIRDVCPVCMREIDKEYEKCSEYLREFKGAIITELSDNTGVSIRQITKFIREGRISLLNAPNMTYPCESCGTLIRENHLCDPCRDRLVKASRSISSSETNNSGNSNMSKADVIYKGLNRYKDK